MFNAKLWGLFPFGSCCEGSSNRERAGISFSLLAADLAGLPEGAGALPLVPCFRLPEAVACTGIHLPLLIPPP